MNRVVRSLMVLTLLVTVSSYTTAQTPDQKVSLVWKFEKEKPFYQEMVTKTQQVMKVMGQDVNQVQQQTFFFKWTPIKQDGTSWILKQTIEGVVMKIDIAGNPISFDSTAPTTPGNSGTPTSPLNEFFKALVGAEFQITLDTKTMKVTKVEGKEEFLKKLSSANPQMESLLKEILSEEALKQMADPTFGVTPTEPKKKDDTWKSSTTLNLGPIGSYDNVSTYKYLGVNDKKLDMIDVETQLTYKAPASSANLPFKIKTAELKTKDKQTPGRILFDNVKGMLVSSDLNLKLSGTLTVEIGNTTTTVELTQEQTTSVRTADVSYIKKK